ncbi:MSCRAMM family protein [Hyalangium rubrum]|uniref:LysM domain-containing protein n=1 Tax=Hyalangium rubrum TaxID=3103134 RepID=A0ABU5H1S9_9BACT|nr:LysM domain-containing protein [Hyalangium sp. s54d21]MDY7226723.1 LysM domain-containing protein [Hyalangium sp. s54d21]
MVSEARKVKAAASHSFSYRLRDGFRDYVLLKFHEPIPERHKPVVHTDLSRVQGWLRHLSQDHSNLQVLRELNYGDASSMAFGTASVDELVRRVATQLVEGRLRLAEVPVVSLGRVLGSTKKEETFFPPPVEEKFSFTLQIVDDVTDEPISGIKLKLKLPGGGTQQASSDGSGTVRASNVSPGLIEVKSVIDGATLDETLAFVKSGAGTSLPQEGRKKASGRFLARLVKYKVSDGETLESVAEANGLSVNELTQFNWGTTAPKEIQKRLFLDVGCRETDASGKFVLTRHDNPGILYIARPMELSLAASGPRQVLRVAKVPAPPVFRFSA